MMEEGKDRDDVKGGEGVTDPIPIAGGKMKKRGVEYKCESCNKVGSSFFFFFPSLTLLFITDLPPPKLFEQTQMGTHPTMARSIQVCPLETPASPIARSRRHPLVHGERSYIPT